MFWLDAEVVLLVCIWFFCCCGLRGCAMLLWVRRDLNPNSLGFARKSHKAGIGVVEMGGVFFVYGA